MESVARRRIVRVDIPRPNVARLDHSCRLPYSAAGNRSFNQGRYADVAGLGGRCGGQPGAVCQAVNNSRTSCGALVHRTAAISAPTAPTTAPKPKPFAYP